MKIRKGPPVASVVLPCLNEERFIEKAVTSLLDEWLLEKGEIIIVDGGSTDGTIEIVERMQDRQKGNTNQQVIYLIENPERFQAFGLNEGIRAAKGNFIVRADARCRFPAHYVRKAVERLQALENEGTANVGGVMRTRSESCRQKLIARAMSHPLGVGDARFHLGGKGGFVDTAYLGTFRKSFLEEIGLYDTSFRTNEDAELNIRTLKEGKKIYLDPDLVVDYFPRNTFRGLARQYFLYGRGRSKTVLKHGRVTSWRQVLPPVLVLGGAAAVLGGIFERLLWLFPIAYMLAISIGAVVIKTDGELRAGIGLKLGSAWAIAIMHVCWGAGFIFELGLAALKK
jgi:succinoglycan biosynthesis protein ExoA